jgi:hypothetical protein
MKYRRIASLKTAEAFRTYLAQIGVDLSFDEEIESSEDAPLAQP